MSELFAGIIFVVLFPFLLFWIVQVVKRML